MVLSRIVVSILYLDEEDPHWALVFSPPSKKDRLFVMTKRRYVSLAWTSIRVESQDTERTIEFSDEDIITLGAKRLRCLRVLFIVYFC